MRVRVTGKDFRYATIFLKKRGFTFDPVSKTWAGSGEVDFLLSDGYAVAVGDVPRQEPEYKLAGMDHADSIL